MAEGYGKLEKVSKKAAHYHATTSPKRRCGKCEYMQQDGTCLKVQGIVAPNDVCDYFEAKG